MIQSFVDVAMGQGSGSISVWHRVRVGLVRALGQVDSDAEAAEEQEQVHPLGTLVLAPFRSRQRVWSLCVTIQTIQ